MSKETTVRIARALLTTPLVTALAVALTASPAPAGAVPTGPILGANDPDVVAGSYIVVLKDEAAPAAQVQSAASTLASRYPGVIRKHLYQNSLRGFSMTANAATAARVAADPAVEAVYADHVVRTTTDQYLPPSWGLDRLDQTGLPLSGTYTYGSADGVTVYVLDTGIRISHADFGGRATNGYDTIDNDAVAQDCHGHGTHVAGTIGGTAYGVAKDVDLVAVRVLDCVIVDGELHGVGSTASVVAGIDWVTANAVQPAVVNMSLGSGVDDVVDDAVAASVASGITYVVAAGNWEEDACQFSPAREPTAITVAATDDSDGRAYFSNYGSCVDIFAPGVYIASASIASDQAKDYLSGTSMAAPHVAGAAALLLAEDPTRTPAQIDTLLKANALTGRVTDRRGSPDKLLHTATGVAARSTIVAAQPVAARQVGVTLFQPASGYWYSYDDLEWVPVWGTGGDIPVAGDYTGDGKLDAAVWRPSTGAWWLQGIGKYNWGLSTDEPVPGDYNGDRVQDVAVWRPSNGTWYVRGASGGTFGTAGDVPVQGDYNRDGRTDLAVWRPSNGTWYVKGQFTVAFGRAGDVPVPADYNGDGRTDVALWRPSNGTWYILGMKGGAYGAATDIPVPADYNGDRKAEVAVYRPTTGYWYARGFQPILFGGAGFTPTSVRLTTKIPS